MRDGFKPALSFSSAESLQNWLTLTKPGKAVLESVIPGWLSSTVAGNAIIDQAAINRTAISEDVLRAEVDQRLAKRARCLIVCHPDGRIEAYGNQVIVHFADMLDVEGPDETTEAEAYLEATLPPKFRRLVMHRPTVHYAYCRTPEQEHARLFALECLSGLWGLHYDQLRQEAIRREKLARDRIGELSTAPF